MGVQQISEGIVIRPTKETMSPSQLTRLTAKYKSPLYEERKSLRNADPNMLPAYTSAYDLIYDFVTAERIRHVLSKATSRGIEVTTRNMRTLSGMLFDDIKKESMGEWPAGSETLDEGTLRRWTSGIAGESLSRLVEGWGQ